MEQNNNGFDKIFSTTNLINHSGQPQSQASSSQVNVDDGNYIDPYFLTLPIGVRFCPNDQELVVDYLMKRVMNESLPKNRIHEVNIYEYHPAILTEKYKRYRETYWYFFTTRDRKYPNGKRPNRVVPGGFWKATGTTVTCIFDSNNNPVASKTPLDFYEGKGKHGSRTEWKMHEYFPLSDDVPSSRTGGMRLNDCVLCVIYRKGEKQSDDLTLTANQDPVDLRIDASTSSHNNSPQPANRAGWTVDTREVYFNGSQSMIQASYGNNMLQGDYGYSINQACYGNNMNQNVALSEPAMFRMTNATAETSGGCSNHVAFAGPSPSTPPVTSVARFSGPNSSVPPTMHVAGLNGPSSSMLPGNNMECNDHLVEPNNNVIQSNHQDNDDLLNSLPDNAFDDLLNSLPDNAFDDAID